MHVALVIKCVIYVGEQGNVVFAIHFAIKAAVYITNMWSISVLLIKDTHNTVMCTELPHTASYVL